MTWKTPSCICSCQWCIKSEVFCGNCWMLRRRLEAATGCRRGPQYDGICSFYLNCYFFRTSPTNRDLREKAFYFPPRMVKSPTRPWTHGAVLAASKPLQVSKNIFKIEIRNTEMYLPEVSVSSTMVHRVRVHKKIHLFEMPSMD